MQEIRTTRAGRPLQNVRTLSRNSVRGNIRKRVQAQVIISNLRKRIGLSDIIAAEVFKGPLF